MTLCQLVDMDIAWLSHGQQTPLKAGDRLIKIQPKDQAPKEAWDIHYLQTRSNDTDEDTSAPHNISRVAQQ